jgi:hypothetical protein
MKATIELTPSSSVFHFTQDVFVPIVGTGGLFPNIDPNNIQSCDIATIELAMQPAFTGGILLFGEDNSTGGHMKIVGSNINAEPTTEVISVATQQNVAVAGFKAANSDVWAFITASIN